MKFSSLTLFLLITSIGLLSGCQSTAKPQVPLQSCSLPLSKTQPTWVEQPQSADQSFYFGYGVSEGSGKSFPKARKLAIAEARKELAEIMSTQVTSKVIINNQRVSSGNIAVVKTQMQNNLVTQSDLLLSNTTVEQHYSDRENCLVWVKVKLSKAEFDKQKQQLTKIANAELNTILSNIGKNVETLLANDQEQNKKLNTIIKNTRKTAIENLLFDYGIQFSPVGFIEGMFTINNDQVDNVLKLFRDAEFDVNAPMSNYPDCMGYSSMYGPQDSENKKQITFFNISNNLTVATCAIAMGLDANRITQMLSILNVGVDDITSSSKLYMSNWISNRFSLFPGQRRGVNPAGVFGENQSFTTSLISYMTPKTAASNLNRGNYTLFHLAAIFNRMDLIEPLMALGYNENAKSKAGYTPLALAIEHGSFEFINKAIQLGFAKKDKKGVAFTLSLIKGWIYIHRDFHPRNGVENGVVTFSAQQNPMFKIARQLKPKNKKVLNRAIKRVQAIYHAANRGNKYPESKQYVNYIGKI